MKEYQTCVENKQFFFYNLLRNPRNQIECAFGRFKEKWRVLLKFEIAPAVVSNCFFLHSFCESKNYSGPDEEEAEAQIMRHRLDEKNNITIK